MLSTYKTTLPVKSYQRMKKGTFVVVGTLMAEETKLGHSDNSATHTMHLGVIPLMQY